MAQQKTYTLSDLVRDYLDNEHPLLVPRHPSRDVSQTTAQKQP